MELLECIKERRSVRKFKSDKVSNEVLAEIAEAAKYAPSWKNTQVTRYYAISGEEMKDKIVECVPDFNKEATSTAPVIMVSTVIKMRSGYNREGETDTPKGKGWQMYDCGLSNMLFCLKAKELGLGTVIMGYYDEEKVSQAIGVPETEEVISIIALGYPDEEPVMPKRKGAEVILNIVD